MAGRNGNPLTAATPGMFVVSGSFKCNNTSAPTDLEGSKFSVVRSAIGVYIVTVKAMKFPGVISSHSEIVAASTSYPFKSRVGFFDTVNNEARFFIYLTDFTAAPAGGDITERVSFTVVYRDTSQRK